MTTPFLGQTLILTTQLSPLREVPFIVSKVIDADTVNGDGLIDTADDWPVTNIPVTHPCVFYEAATRGTGVGQWRESAVGLQGPAGPTGATGPAGSAGAAGATGATGPGALVTSTNVRAYTLGTAIQPDATHDVEISGAWTISTTISVLAGSGATGKLFSDSSSNPTTEIPECRVSNANSGVLGLVNTQTVPFHFRVKAGDRYKLTATIDAGTATCVLVGGTVREQVLG